MDATSPRENAFWKPARCDRMALVLQGGGALGAYQAGVYQALHEADIEPEWISGVSIGAINSALIAGNPRERRLERLREFWTRITDRRVWLFTPDGDASRRARNSASALYSLTLGQPGFFTPRLVNPWLAQAGARDATSYYTTDALAATLADLVDFDLINERRQRFSVGAVNVLTGNFVFFDNASDVIEPCHVMASGALPPALPMVKVGTDFFWDGGLVSNTPLQHLLDEEDALNTLVFQIDLFSARGTMPRDIQDVMSRQKDIVYSSRTRHNTDVHRRLHKWKTIAHDALAKVPDDRLSEEERAMRDSLFDLPEITILQLIYQQKAYEGHAKDYEFSATSMREHWTSGYEDTRDTLRHKDWIAMPPEGAGIVVHDVHRQTEQARLEAAFGKSA